MALDGVILRLQEGKVLLSRCFCRSYNPSARLRNEAITCACVRLEMPEASSFMLTSRR